MVNWKSLFFFLLTLIVVIGTFCSLAVWGYNQGLGVLAALHPEVMKTPNSSTIYTVNKTYKNQFVEYRDTDQGYSLLLPKGYKIVKTKEDPSLIFIDPQDKWEVILKEKLLRYDDTIQSKGLLNNPEGDYYILIDKIFREKINPLLLAEKIMYLPGTTKEIKTIITPNFPQGYLVVAQDGDNRQEIYRLFDDQYWHNIFVTIYDPKVPHNKIETIIASLKNDVYIPPTEKSNKKF